MGSGCTNCYPAAGQTVMHFHVHVIPRYDAEEGFILEMKNNAEGLNLPAIAKEIKFQLLSDQTGISKKTLEAMDEDMKNLEKGIVSGPIKIK